MKQFIFECKKCFKVHTQDNANGPDCCGQKMKLIQIKTLGKTL